MCGIGCDQVVWDDRLKEIKPEERKPCEDPPFEGNAAAENMIEGGYAVAGYEEESIGGEGVDVTNLAAGCEGKRSEIGLNQGFWHRLDGTTFVFCKNRLE